MLNLVLFAPQLLESKFGWCSFCHWWAKPIPDHQVCLPCCHGFALVASQQWKLTCWYLWDPPGAYSHIKVPVLHQATSQSSDKVLVVFKCLKFTGAVSVYNMRRGGKCVSKAAVSSEVSLLICCVVMYIQWVISFSSFLTCSSSALHV